MSTNNKKDNTEVLSYKIDTTEFDRGMNKIVAALEKLEKREYLTKLQDSVNGIGSGIENIDFAGMERGISSVESSFSAMGIVGMTVINSITNALIGMAQRWVFDDLLKNAVNGFAELNLQINATQTILANTSSRFGTTLKDVNTGLDALNEYADKTIYNYSNMTQAVGAFTASGIDLGNSIQAIKGVANAAAYAGVGTEAAASGMYQFSNALSMGYMMLYQWRSLSISGLGTKALQDELVASARGLGIDIDNILKEAGGSFQYSLESGWANAEVIMHTLAKFSGDVTKEQLKAMKYTDKEIERILALGKAATESATKVVSYEKLITSLNEAIGSGWAKTFRLLVGDFEQGKALFTMISENLLVVIERGAKNRNKLIEEWARFGGRDVIVKTIDRLLKMYSTLMLTVGQAMNQIFPPITGEQIAKATKYLGKLIESLMPTTKGLENIGKIVKGFMSLIDLPIQFFKAMARYLWLLIEPLTNFKTTWIDSAVGFAEFITNLRTEVIKGDLFFKRIQGWGENVKKFWDKVKLFIEDLKKTKIGKVMQELLNAISMKTGIKDLESVKKFLSDMQASLVSFFKSFDKTKALESIGKFFGAIVNFGKRVYRFIEPAILYVIKLVSNFAIALGKAFEDLATNLTWDKLKDVLDVLMKFVSLKTLTNILTNFGFASEFFMTLGMGFAKTIGYFSAALKQFINSNDTDSLLAVAIAIGILSASVFMLATLPKEDMERGIAGISAIYAGLAASLLALNTILSESDTLTNMLSGSFKLALLPPVLIALALAVGIMADALIKFNGVPLTQVLKGFGALSGILAAMSIFMIVNKKFGALSLSTGLGILSLSVSMIVLAKALKMFADVEWEDIGKGAAVLGGLAIVTAVITKVNAGPQLLLMGIGMAAIAGALSLLVLSFKYLASIDYETANAGLTTLIVMMSGLYLAAFAGGKMSLVIIKNIALTGLAIGGLALVFTFLAKINPTDILLVTTAIALAVGILYLAVSFIQPNILTSVEGLFVMSTGLAAFALALSLFKYVDFKAAAFGGAALLVFITALTALAGLTVAFPPLGVALGVIASVLFTAGAGFMFFGASLLFAGAGFKMFAEGLALLAEGGTKMVESFIRSIPKFGEAIVKFMATLTKAIVSVAPMITIIATTIIIAISKAIIETAPWIVQALVVLFNGMLDFFDRVGEKLYPILGKWFMRTLRDLEKNIKIYVVLWNKIQKKFIDGMAETMGPLVDSVYNYFVVFFGSLADTIEEDGAKLRSELFRLSKAILNFFVLGLYEGVTELNDASVIVVKYWLGQFWAKVVEKKDDFKKIGEYVLAGLVLGLLNPFGIANLDEAIGTIVAIMTAGLKAGLWEKSPSKKSFQIGAYYMEGLVNGLDTSELQRKLVTMKDTMLSFMDGALSTDLNFQPVLSPVLDLGAMAAIERTVASAFGGQPLAFASSGYALRSDPRLQQYPIMSQESVVFQQSISSAAPLSVEEIARRTTSLMAQSRRKA